MSHMDEPLGIPSENPRNDRHRSYEASRSMPMIDLCRPGRNGSAGGLPLGLVEEAREGPGERLHPPELGGVLGEGGGCQGEGAGGGEAAREAPLGGLAGPGGGPAPPPPPARPAHLARKPR